MAITPLMPVYPRCGFRPVRGDHCHLIGEDGRRYLDFAAGIAVNILGHSHEGLIGAIQRQAATLMHVSNLYGSPQGEHLAQRLVDLTFADTVFFTNSGAEAVECAIKTVRAYHAHAGNEQRCELITFNNAFHGRTMATISASNQEKMHKGFLPLLPGFRYVPFDDLAAAKADRSVHGRRLYTDPSTQITDQVGVRIITYLREDVTAVGNLLVDGGTPILNRASRRSWPSGRCGGCPGSSGPARTSGSSPAR